MIKVSITSLQVRQHENFRFFFERKEIAFLIYLEKIQIPVPRKHDPHLMILYETRGSILFEKDFTEKKKSLWRRKRNKTVSGTEN